MLIPPAAQPVPAVTPLVTLDRKVAALAAPRAGARVVGVVAARTHYTDSPMTLPVLARAGSGTSGWVRVRLPTRPDGATGWIHADAGSAGSTSWEIVIHLAARQAVILEDGHQQEAFPVIVGKSSTPTPTGRFFVVEKLHIAPGVAEGPWALATSAYSHTLREFDGGVGQVALHGTTGLTGALGTFSSHGCVRLSPAAITWVADHVDPGTPVTITR